MSSLLNAVDVNRGQHQSVIGGYTRCQICPGGLKHDYYMMSLRPTTKATIKLSLTRIQKGLVQISELLYIQWLPQKSLQVLFYDAKWIYSPKFASFIKPCKMGSHKWHILVDSKISHLCGCTVFRPSKIYSILSENGHIIMPLGVPLLISNACSVLLLYLPLLFSPFPPLLCPEKENLSQCTDMYHPSQRTQCRKDKRTLNLYT